MKRLLVLVLLVSLAVFTVSAGGDKDAGGSSAPAQRNVSLTVAGADVGSVIYVNAAGMAEWVSRESSFVKLSAQTTQGLIENVRLVGRGDVDIGFLSTGSAYEGMNGSGAFKGEPPYTDILCLGVAYDGQMYVVAKEDINSIDELVGKAFNIGPPGSNLALYGTAILRGHGIYDKVRVSHQPVNDGVDMFVRNDVQAVMGGPYPFPSILSLSAQAKCKILGVDPNSFPAMNEVAKCYPVTVPKTAYTFMTEDIVTAGFANYIVAHKRVSNEVVYEILSKIMSPEGIDYLKKSTTTWQLEDNPKKISSGDSIRAANLKMHPGAVKYWEDHGVKVPNDIK